MASKKRSARTASVLGMLALIALLAAIGAASELFLHARVDLTRDREFTLSRASRKTLENLPDIVTVKVVMSRNLPAQFQQLRTQAVDLLREFQARSRGKLKLEFEDPGTDDVRRQQALSLGVQEVVLQEQNSEGAQAKKGFFGLALLYGDKKEVFPVLQNLETFEYDLVVRLKKMTGTPKVVGVVEGGEGARFAFALPGAPRAAAGFAGNFPTLRQEIEKLYNLQAVDAAAPVPGAVDLLLVVAPARLTDLEKFRIDQYLMSGKPVVFLTPGLDVSLESGINGLSSENGYEDLLAHYGLGVRQNAVLEPRYLESVRFGDAFFPSPYPYWVIVPYASLDAKSPITSSLQALSFPWTSSLEIDSAAQPSAKIEVLARTTDQAWEETEKFDLYPKDPAEYVPVGQRSFPLAALELGRLTSFYARSPLPAGLGPADSAAVLTASRGEGRLLVVSNALFASDFYLGYSPNAAGNVTFLLNAIDQLVLDPDLIHVRSREIAGAPLDEAMKARARVPLLWLNLSLAPLLLLLAGGLAAWRRGSREARA